MWRKIDFTPVGVIIIIILGFMALMFLKPHSPDHILGFRMAVDGCARYGLILDDENGRAFECHEITTLKKR